MADQLAYAYTPQDGWWELQSDGHYVLVSSVDPQLARDLAHYDAVRQGANGLLEFHSKSGAWVPETQVGSAATNGNDTSGTSVVTPGGKLRDAGTPQVMAPWNGPMSPVATSASAASGAPIYKTHSVPIKDTDSASATYGQTIGYQEVIVKDASGNPVLDTDKMEARDAKRKKEAAVAEKANRPKSTQPVFYTDPQTGERWVQDSSGDWKPAPRQERQIPADEARMTRDINQRSSKTARDVRDQAFIDGNFERALAFDDVIDRPTSVEAIRLALQYGEGDPEAIQALYTWIRSAGGMGGTGGFAKPIDLSAIPIGTHPALTSEQIQAQGARQDYVAQQQAKGLHPAEGFFDPNQPFQLPPPNAGKGDVYGDASLGVDITPPRTAAQTQYDINQDTGFSVPTSVSDETPMTPEEIAAEAKRQEYARLGIEGPNLSDFPTPEEMRKANGGRTLAAPGVIVPESIRNNPSVSYYNPGPEQQLNDYINEFDAGMAGLRGNTFKVPEGVTRDMVIRSKAAQLGIAVPKGLGLKEPEGLKLPPDLFKKRRALALAPTRVSAPRSYSAA